MKQTPIYLWQDEDYCYPVIRKMSSDDYNPHDNAASIAKALMNSCPGNTLDILLDSIAGDILNILKSDDGKELLLSDFDIQNRIRGTLERLSTAQS